MPIFQYLAHFIFCYFLTRENYKLKIYLINALVVKGCALADRILAIRAEGEATSEEERRLQEQMDQTFIEVQKWAEPEEKKVGPR